MQSYTERRGRAADFVVKYRYLPASEGSRLAAPHQHMRSDFQYDDDRDQVWMIWPEFVDPSGTVLPEGPVPMEGTAQMFILDDSLRHLHQQRLSVGRRGFIVEGSRRVAECEVVEIGAVST